MRFIRKSYRPVKLVKIDVEDVEFNEGGTEAIVEIAVKYYKTPSYVINTRIEREVWAYNRFHGGWLLSNAEIEEGSEAPAALEDIRNANVH